MPRFPLPELVCARSRLPVADQVAGYSAGFGRLSLHQDEIPGQLPVPPGYEERPSARTGAPGRDALPRDERTLRRPRQNV